MAIPLCMKRADSPTVTRYAASFRRGPTSTSATTRAARRCTCSATATQLTRTARTQVGAYSGPVAVMDAAHVPLTV
jgi:hypothetical protein